MYTEEDIASAIKAGILSNETAEAFRAHVAGERQGPAVDEEHFRLITGFNDIFVVIASVLLLASVGGIAGVLTDWIGAAAVAAVAWLLAEFFTRQRRMALPSIVLLLAFVSSVMGGVLLLLGPEKGAQSVVIASALATLAAWLHWRRFQVPITVAAGAAVGVAFAVALLLWAAPDARHWLSVISFIAGVAVFVLAMYWDTRDTARLTRKSDVAFWLHLLAAPLLVHPVFAALGVFEGQMNLWQAAVVILLYVAIGFVSLCIDRRALMVSALVYVMYAFSTLLEQYGVVSLSFALTALVIGSALLLLSAFWHASRAQVLRRVPLAVQRWLVPAR
ncbi:hypothetical protein [Thiohalophilus sp.]|uniref:hypothetical protein n=1 Tax=Thiohalophilus sp. TaxID=3028392 RepID=UPI002ACDB46B|nr:hypothetical protein [Thiohalophilus sp.]MDZ7661358.1 hypothetical protein [Thiohalophilus sp.]